MKNYFKLSNRITVCNGKKTISAHNGIKSLASLLTARGGYAKYICVATTHNGESLEGTVIAKESVLTEYNFDPDNGTLFASYEACFTDDDISSGSAFQAVALSPYTGDGEIANLAEIGEVTKVEKQDLIVKVEMFLSFSTDCMRFTSGENALVKRLLGADAIDENAFTLATGENYLNEAISIPRSTNKLKSVQSATVTYQGGTLTISATFSDLPYELVLLYEGTPVMRGVYIGDVENVSGVATLRKNSSFEILGEHVFYVNGLSSDGVEITDYEEYDLCSGVTLDCPQLIKHRLDRGTGFLSEPTCAYLATISEREICVYQVERNSLAPKYRVKATGRNATLMADGSIYQWNGALSLRYFDGDKVSVKNLPYDGITAFTATVEDGVHHVALVQNGDFIRFTYSPTDETITQIESILSVPDDFGINRRCSRFIDYWSKTNALYRSVTVSGYSENNQTTLKTYVGSAATLKCTIHGKWLRRLTASGTYRVEYMEGSSNFTLKSYDPVFFCGQYALLQNSGKTSIMQPLGTRFTISSNLFSEPMGTAVDMAQIGKYLLIMFDDGKVATAYPIRYGVGVYCYGYSSGTTVAYHRISAVKGNGNAVNVTTTITLGEQNEV